MRITLVKTWSENTKEGESYLRYNGYRKAKRLFKTDYYICLSKGIELADVKILR